MDYEETVEDLKKLLSNDVDIYNYLRVLERELSEVLEGNEDSGFKDISPRFAGRLEGLKSALIDKAYSLATDNARMVNQVSTLLLHLEK